jgi:rhodanese-related sulfurtransferase
MVEIKTIKAEQAKKWLDDEKAILVDVREDNEHNMECIACAHHIPLDALDAAKFAKEKKAIIFHCRMGKRSMQAAQKIHHAHPKLKIYSLEGGIEAWKHCGLKTECHSGMGKCKMMPVCMTSAIKGVLIVGGTMLGYMHETFLLIPLLVGAGMIVKGYTGWCGMENMIAKCTHCDKNKCR